MHLVLQEVTELNDHQWNHCSNSCMMLCHNYRVYTMYSWLHSQLGSYWSSPLFLFFLCTLLTFFISDIFWSSIIFAEASIYLLFFPTKYYRVSQQVLNRLNVTFWSSEVCNKEIRSFRKNVFHSKKLLFQPNLWTAKIKMEFLSNFFKLSFVVI